jgi:hypothetical protein
MEMDNQNNERKKHADILKSCPINLSQIASIAGSMQGGTTQITYASWQYRSWKFV